MSVFILSLNILSFLHFFSQTVKPELYYPIHTLSPDTTCMNMGFEECSFSGWELFKGTAIGDTSFSYANDTSVSPGIQHFITDGGFDPVVSASNPPALITKTFGAGSCSALLGDSVMTGANASKLKQTFYVDSLNSVLTFHYAAVLQDPSHPSKDQPYFTVKVYDSTGTMIPCGQYNIIAGPVGSGGDPDFIVTTYNGESLSYKDWTTEFVDLGNYTGQNLTVEYIVADCAQGGHFGYVYLDGSCALGTEQQGITPLFENGCGNFPVTLNGIKGVKSYLWNTGDTTPDILVNSNGIFSLTVTGSSGCTNSYSLDFQNNVSATANFSFEGSCAGNPVTFTDLSTGSLITGWQWDFGDGSGFSGEVNPQYTYDTAGTYYVSLTVTINSGCTADTVIPITINNSGGNSIAAPDSVCLNGNLLTLTASDSGGTWAGTGIIDSIAGIFDPLIAGVGEHTIIYADSGFCFDTVFHQITVNGNPSLLVDSVRHVSCFGGNDGAFFTSGSGGMPPYTYLWGSGCLSCNPFNLSQGTYFYIITDAKECSDSAEIIITQPDSLQISISGPADTLCENDSTLLAVNVSGGIFPYSYKWTNGDTTQTIIASASQLYKVTVIDANECTGTAPASINFFPVPVVNLGGDTIISENENLVLNAGNSGSSYIWSTGETTQSITINSAGTYYVIVTDPNNCSANDSITVAVIADVSEKPEGKGYSAFPNPVKGTLFIEKNNSLPTEYTLFDSMGKVIYKIHAIGPALELNTHSYPAGLYYLLVTDEKISVVYKLLFEK